MNEQSLITHVQWGNVQSSSTTSECRSCRHLVDGFRGGLCDGFRSGEDELSCFWNGVSWADLGGNDDYPRLLTSSLPYDSLMATAKSNSADS